MILEPYCKLKPSNFKEYTHITNRPKPKPNKAISFQSPQHQDNEYSTSNLDSSYNNSNRNYENSKSHIKALVQYITDACKDDQESILLDQSSVINPLSNHEQENYRAVGILKGCRQMKQIRVAFDVYNQMRTEGINISAEVYHELLDCCLKCDALTRACYVIRKMDKHGYPTDPDLLDHFLELYNRTQNKPVLHTQETPDLDESDIVMKDFTPQIKSNVWLDQSLDKYYNKFKDDEGKTYQLDLQEEEMLKHKKKKERVKRNITLPVDVYMITEELLKDDSRYGGFFKRNSETHFNQTDQTPQGQGIFLNKDGHAYNVFNHKEMYNTDQGISQINYDDNFEPVNDSKNTNQCNQENVSDILNNKNNHIKKTNKKKKKK